MNLVVKTDGSVLVDGTLLPHTQIMSIGEIKESQPTRVTLSIDFDEIAISHSAKYDAAIARCKGAMTNGKSVDE